MVAVSNEILDDFLAGALVSGPDEWPQAWTGDAQADRLFARAVYHGLPLLLVDRPDAGLASWPARVVASLRKEAVTQAIWELSHRKILVDLLRALADEGIDALVMKGTALAYALYADPAARRRGDTDLLIRESDLPRARRIFANLGYRRPHETQGTFGDLHYEENWQIATANGLTHDIDLHWQVTNSRALARVLDVEECLARSVPLPRLDAMARATDPVLRLVQGLVNRAMHKNSGYFSFGEKLYDNNRLVWAMDYHLQAARFSDDDWGELVQLAVDRGIAPVCLDGLSFAMRRLDTSIPTRVIERLEAAPQLTPEASYIAPGSAFTKAMADFRAEESAAARLRFVLARIFPSSAHMRAKYAHHREWPLAFLYVRRLLAWLGRLGRASRG